jgi:hydrogenase expression/formation protein HypE
MDKILLAHGSGGRLMHRLIGEHMAASFKIAELGDSAILDIDPARLAFTTDSYVVSPIFFPGGDIGRLAVCGTVNDLAVAGAKPLFLSAGFIIEEGFTLEALKKIIKSMRETAEGAGVKIVAGDTKVVNKGKGDGIFINTSGIGIMEDGIEISPKNIQAGDSVIISGEIANHGTAIIAERNGISFEPPVVSDAAPLNGLVQSMLSFTKNIRFMRDPTRGGLATTLKECALDSGKCIRIIEKKIPVSERVKGGCDLLGLDPLYVANEGILVAVVAKGETEPLLREIQKHPLGANAALIGRVEDAPEKMVLMETRAGGTRIIDMLEGEQLPRIC